MRHPNYQRQPADDLAILTVPPVRNSDPFVYRLHEMVDVYGESLRTLTNEQFLAWGWRLAFILSFVLVLVGLYIRLNIMETPEFAKLKEKKAEAKIPFATMMADYPKEIVAGMYKINASGSRTAYPRRHPIHAPSIASAR